MAAERHECRDVGDLGTGGASTFLHPFHLLLTYAPSRPAHLSQPLQGIGWNIATILYDVYLVLAVQHYNSPYFARSALGVRITLVWVLVCITAFMGLNIADNMNAISTSLFPFLLFFSFLSRSKLTRQSRRSYRQPHPGLPPLRSPSRIRHPNHARSRRDVSSVPPRPSNRRSPPHDLDSVYVPRPCRDPYFAGYDRIGVDVDGE
jgi:hypothetical protein